MTARNFLNFKKKFSYSGREIREPGKEIIADFTSLIYDVSPPQMSLPNDVSTCVEWKMGGGSRRWEGEVGEG